jgi:hypothetical protein
MGVLSGLGSQVTSRAIIPQLYVNRGLITHRTGSQQCLRRSNGELWVLVLHPGGFITVYISRDNGFSWIEMDADPSTTLSINNVNTFECHGPHLNWIVSEKWSRVQFIFPDNSTPDVQGVSIPIDSFLSSTDGSGTFTTSNFTVLATSLAEENYFRIVNNQTNGFIVYRNTSNRIAFRKISPRSNALSSISSISGTEPIRNTLGLYLDKNSQLYMLYDREISSSHRITFIRYDDEAVAVTTAVELLDLTTTKTPIGESLDITKDGLNNLCAVWTAVDTDEETTIYYSTSIDNGFNWDTNALSRTSGHSSFVDTIRSEGAGRTSVIGSSSGGFILCYTENSVNNVPKTWVRRLTTADNGLTYDLGDEEEIASHLSYVTPVVGARFFHPMNGQLMDLSDPGLCRVAYQINEGHSTTFADVKPIIIGQELLFTSAFSSDDTGTYTLDTTDSSSLMVQANILGSLTNNSDYYALGATGEYTDRYLAAFNRLGNTMKILKYEPTESAYLNDRSAYGSPTQYETLSEFSSQSYAFPTPETTDTIQTSYIEQDIRKLYLPPDFHLSRQFVINEGGFLKRTVWICQFGGNEYELSQVVPHLINNQICYYEANAYVVGPSRDPFARDVLPSET